MDIRAFVLGAASGALIYGAVSWFLEDDRRDPSTAVTEAADESRADPGATAATSPTDSRDPPERSEAAALVDPAGTEPVPAAESAPDPVPASDSSNAGERWLAEAYEGLIAEPKDDSWSYYMEQAMLQFLARHGSMGAFEIAYAECRTTQCQIRVAGYDESTGPTWDRIVHEMGREPWYEFGQRGNSSAVIDGRLVIIQEFRRK